ncbi:MAG: Na+/H+ antiporter NhaA [Phycisphaerales bacterium]|nr:Na+/H+ antiporter NhaA [Phycisphaerales bacterium]
MHTPPAPIDALVLPFQRFLRLEASGGILLLAATVLALLLANSPWAATFASVWDTTLTLGAGSLVISKPLLLWINDGLMAIFFFVVGLEIKREVLVGELSSGRKALLPAAAALGGMAGPALIYLAFNRGGTGIDGWGVPMATDIAFVVGLLALLGPRVPLGLKVFLVALAIVDDLGAVLVIAFFYTDALSVGALVVAGGVMAALIVANRLGVRRPTVYIALGVVLWVAVLKSGVHATIAGVLLALTIPARIALSPAGLRATVQSVLNRLDVRDDDTGAVEARQTAIHRLEDACELAQTPLHRLEHALLPWVSYLIMPVFALANAGIALGSGIGEAFRDPITLGIAVGLFVGNQIGITGLSWIIVRLGAGRLPDGVGFRHIHAASCLAGVGFTMSLFIGGLAFTDPAPLHHAKLGILAGSLASGLVGMMLLWRVTRGHEA